MFKSTNLVRLVAALTLVAAFAVTPSTADAGNFKTKKFQSGHFHHKHHFHHNHFGFHGHHFHKHHFHKPYFPGVVFPGQVIAVPYGTGVVYVIK